MTLRVADAGEKLVLEVADTGIGIKKEELSTIFEPFKQLDAKRNRNIRGTGLGLSICRDLAKSMGGVIALDSVYGQGSTFSVTLPKVVGNGANIIREEESLRTAFNPNARVLVVDDNPVNLRVAAGLIELDGIACDTADSGAKALKMAEQNAYDVIFMDHMMPDMDGIETTRRLRAMGGRLDGTPIVALTANAATGIEETFLSAGMNDYLAKPVERRKLQGILSSWMPHKPTTRAIAPAAAATGRAKPPGQPGHRPTARGILELAKDIEGLDVDLGLSRVSNQQDIDTETLHLAGETMPSLIDSIVAAHAAGDLERLAAEVHGAKGSLASIGATSLSQQAAELEKAGKAGDRAFCDANLHPFLEGLERLGYTLHGVFTVFTSPATVLYGNRTRLESRLHKLIRALTIKDERTIERTIASVTNRDFGADVDRKLLATKDLIEKKDYTAAIKHIESYVFDIDE